MGQESFSGVKYREAYYSKPQFPDVPVIQASGIATDQSQAFNALVKPVVLSSNQRTASQSIPSLLNPLLTMMHLVPVMI